MVGSLILFPVFEALLYELLYTCVLGIEEEDLHVALDGFRGGGGRRYRNSLSVCSEDAGFDPLEDCAPRSFYIWFGSHGVGGQYECTRTVMEMESGFANHAYAKTHSLIHSMFIFEHSCYCLT